MYHAFARQKLNQALEGLNKDIFESSLTGIEPQLEHKIS